MSLIGSFPFMDLANMLAALERFSGSNLSITLASVEADLRGASLEKCNLVVADSGAGEQALAAAAALKRVAGQVNVAIHALGILLCLPHVLEPGELVEYVSLGAGNTGRRFDLETNLRVAEFKFIHWRGGPESIRQNSIFKDFFLLAEHESTKRKYLYVLGTEHPLKFFNARRDLSSVLSKDKRVRDLFYARFGERYQIVRDYFQEHGGRVIIADVSPWVPELLVTGLEEAE
jgi:hypothetical protein